MKVSDFHYELPAELIAQAPLAERSSSRMLVVERGAGRLTDRHFHDLPIGLPQITVSDLNLNFGGPSGFPQGREDTFGIFSDTATYLIGKHSVKFGGEFRRFLNANFSGDAGTLGFNSVANFQAGHATTFSITLYLIPLVK